jgi:autophagy-related protein 9
VIKIGITVTGIKIFREKLRHLNEMDHELDARLNRSYEFAARYTDQFISPLAKIVARNVAFVAASILVVLLALTAFDEDTLKASLHALKTLLF